MLVPRATYRLQLHRDFTLNDAATVVDYLADMGLSHLYLSPVFTARPGSTHGYDGLCPNEINPELGGRDAFIELSSRARERGLGLILDIVPNHLAAVSPDNPWWTDVLAKGRGSGYADFFDIDWQRPHLKGKVLLPILGHPYGQSLAAGEICLKFDEATDSFHLAAFGALLPLRPESQADLRAECMHQGREQVLEGFVGAEGAERLHELLENQHYRLAWWRTAADDINWRRFFEISELVGVRVERPEVFEAVHHLVFRLYREGWIDGVRVDHVDGLADPAGYCRALRARLNRLAAERPAGAVLSRPYIIVEKILADHEPLRADWLVDGTTGYEFMSDVSAVLHDQEGEGGLLELWAELAPDLTDLDGLLRAARSRMIYANLSSEFENLARLFKKIADLDPASRDVSLSMIRRSLAAVLEEFRVYRTYYRQGRGSAADEELAALAVAGARRGIRAADHEALEWLGSCFGLPAPDFPGPEGGPLLTEAVTRFQQLTAPLAAKSLEDTVFYGYMPLISRNEVGSDPARLALSADEFHGRLLAWGQRFPHRMLATATHDHKRGEDARARLAVLSEARHLWRPKVEKWLNDLSALCPGPVKPDGADLYMILQTLVGAWPYPPALISAGDDPLELMPQSLAARLSQWLTKAQREAKRHTDWIAVNTEYEEASQNCLRGLFSEGGADILAEIGRLADILAPAGAVNSLAQVTLRLTAPGLPDLYQGTERWDFSLVDPDNRRPVDYDDLRAALTLESSWPELMANWRDGRLKQGLIRQILHLRRDWTELFEQGRYVPLETAGSQAKSCLAFLRRRGDEAVIVAVSRLVFNLAQQTGLPLVPAEAWGDTALVPAAGRQGGWFNGLTGRVLGSGGQRKLPLAEVFSDLPVALLLPN